MVRIKLLLLSAVIANSLALTGCSQTKKPSGNITVKEAVGKSVVSRNQVQVVDLSDIQGVWWISNNDPSALFFVEGDSLYYVDEQESPYFLMVKGDTLRMLRDRIISSFAVVRLTPDSLIIFDPTVNDRIILFKKE